MALWRPSDDTTNARAFWLTSAPINADGSAATSTITQAAGTASQWNDLSSNARHASNATGSTQPSVISSGLNSKAVLRFAGTHRLDFASSFSTGSAFTLIAVIKETTANVIANIVGATGGGQFFTSASAFGAGGPGAWDGSLARADSATFAGTGWHIVVIQPTKVFIDGTEVASYAQAGTVASFLLSTIGLRPDNIAATGFSGDIAELILISATIGPTDREYYEGYAAGSSVWNLAANLPSGHTFKSAAPTVSGGSGATGSGSYTEASDTAAGSGTAGAAGSGGATEGGDTGAGSGASGSTGSGSYTEAADAGAGSGNVFAGFAGSGGYTEAGDTAAGAGASGSTGSGSSTEAGDTGAGSGNASSPATGSGSYTEAPDTAVGYAPGLDPSKVAGGGAGYTLEDWAEAAKQKRKRKKAKKGGELLEQIAEGRKAAEAHKAAVLAELTAPPSPVDVEVNDLAEVAPDGPAVLQASDPVPAPEAAPMASIKPELDELLVEIRADMQRAVHDIIGHFRLSTSALSSEVRTLQRENAELRRHMAILSDDLETYQAFALAQAGGKVH